MIDGCAQFIQHQIQRVPTCHKGPALVKEGHRVPIRGCTELLEVVLEPDRRGGEAKPEAVGCMFVA